MIGLLHRLAARAAGTARSVRSDARLPYGGGALPWADAPRPLPVGLSQARAPGPGRQASPTGSRPGRSDPRPVTPAAPLTAIRAEAPPKVAPPVGHEPVDEFEAGTPREREPPLGADKLLSIQDKLPLPATEGRQPAEHHHRNPPEPVSEGDTSVASDVALEHVETAPALTPAEPVAHLSLMAERSAPGLTLPPAMRFPLPASPQAVFPREPAAASSDEAAEVHIHIGRIEVTAVHEAPPPPRRRQAPVQAPMSLDAYLAKRGRS
jgi:hypothetical protein